MRCSEFLDESSTLVHLHVVDLPFLLQLLYKGEYPILGVAQRVLHLIDMRNAVKGEEIDVPQLLDIRPGCFPLLFKVSWVLRGKNLRLETELFR